MTASTYYNNDLYPYYGRLNGHRGLGAWCPKTSNDRSDFLQVDMGEEFYVCAVATQGYKNGNHWAKSYKLQLSLQTTTWETYSEDGAEKVRKINLLAHLFLLKFLFSFGRLLKPVKPWYQNTILICVPYTFSIELVGIIFWSTIRFILCDHVLNSHDHSVQKKHWYYKEKFHVLKG